MEEVPKISPNQKQGAELLSQVPKATLPSAPPGFYKSLVFDFVIVISSIAAGIVFQKFLAEQSAFIWALIAMGVFAVFSVLGSLLTKNYGHRVLVIALEAVGFILPFLGLAPDILGISFGVMFILLFWGENLSRADAENSVEIRFFRIIKRPLSKILSALALVGVILYLPAWSQSSALISRASFDSIFGLTTKVVAGLYPEYQFGSNLGAFAQSIAQGQLEKDAQFNLLPPAIRTKVLDDASGKLLDSFSQAAGIQLNPQDTFAAVAYDFLNKSLRDLRTKFGTTFIVFWALVVFLTVRGLSALLGYPIALLAYLLYQIMISMRIIKVTTENKPHEIVEFF